MHFTKYHSCATTFWLNILVGQDRMAGKGNMTESVLEAIPQPEGVVQQGRLKHQGAEAHITYLSVTAGKMKNIHR